MTPALQSMLDVPGLRSPLQLANLAAWFDALDPASMVIDSSNRVSLWADKSGNSAVNCMVTNGSGSAYASVPDSAPLQLTTDVEIIIGFRPSTLAPASFTPLVGKRNGTSTAGYSIELTTAGKVGFRASQGVSLTVTADSLALPTGAFGKVYVRIRRTSSSGSIAFDYSTDFSNWTTLGTATSATGAITTSTDGLGIGAYNGAGSLLGGSAFAGAVFYVSIGGAIGGAPVFAVDFSTFSKLVTSGTASTGQTVTIGGAGDLSARICGERDLYQGTVSKQPVYLAWAGTNYGYVFGGTTTNTFTTTTTAETGAVEVIVQQNGFYVAGTSMAICGDRTGTPSGWSFISASGDIYFQPIIAGVNQQVPAGLSAPQQATLAAASWFKLVGEPNNGGGRTISIYTSSDGVSWVLLKTSTVAGSGGSITASAGNFTVNGTPASVNGGGGKILRLKLNSGVGGSTVRDFDPTRYTSGTTFTASTGETWTLNGGATIVTRTSLYGDGSDDYMKAAAFSQGQPETTLFVGQQVKWSAGLYFFDGNATTTLLVRQKSSGGASPDIELFPGSTLLGPLSTLSIAVDAVLSAIFNGASSQLRRNREVAITGGTGSTASNGFTFAAQATGLNNGNIRASEIAIYSRALTTTEQDRFALYAGRRHRIAV